MTSENFTYLNAVWGSSSTNIYVGSGHGNIGYYDGSSWTGMKSGAYEALHGFWGPSGTHVFAAGGHGMILRHRY